MIILAALLLLAKRAKGSQRSEWRALGAFAQRRPGVLLIRLPACADASPVKCRAPGSSEHASPFRRTEARAKRTLERAPPKKR